MLLAACPALVRVVGNEANALPKVHGCVGGAGA